MPCAAMPCTRRMPCRVLCKSVFPVDDSWPAARCASEIVAMRRRTVLGFNPGIPWFKESATVPGEAGFPDMKRPGK